MSPELILKTKRHEANMTQAEIAQRLGISTGAYGHYETGRRSPKPDALKMIADAYGCSVDDLYRKETEDVSDES